MKKIKHSKLISIKIPLLILLTLISFNSLSAQVDMLVYYDKGTKKGWNQSPEAMIRHHVELLNQALSSAKVDMTVRIVGMVERESGGGVLGDALGRLSQDGQVRAKANQVGADVIIQFADIKGNCGLAQINGQYGVVRPHCLANRAFTHEVGHTFGLLHAGNNKGPNVYNRGHYFPDGVHNTPMASSANGLINTFSNPNIKCNGMPCGVRVGEGHAADAARYLNENKNKLANRRPTRAPGGGNGNGENLTNGVYQVKFESSGKCLDVYGAQTGDRIKAIQWNCHHGRNQQFRLEKAGEGNFTLMALHSQKCLQLSQRSNTGGVDISQYQCSNRPIARWNVEPISGSGYRVVSEYSGKAMTADNNANGAVIVQEEWSGSNKQNLVFTKLSN